MTPGLISSSDDEDMAVRFGIDNVPATIHSSPVSPAVSALYTIEVIVVHYKINIYTPLLLLDMVLGSSRISAQYKCTGT